MKALLRLRMLDELKLGLEGKHMSQLNAPFTGGPTLNDGVTMPWLGLGVWQTQDGDEVIQAVKAAVETGYRSIDTAYRVQQ